MATVGDQILSNVMLELIGADEFTSVIAGRPLKDVALEMAAAIETSLAIAMIRRQEIAGYSMNGRSLTINTMNAQQVADRLRKLASGSGGIITMPVEFGA